MRYYIIIDYFEVKGLYLQLQTKDIPIYCGRSTALMHDTLVISTEFSTRVLLVLQYCQ